MTLAARRRLGALYASLSPADARGPPLALAAPAAAEGEGRNWDMSEEELYLLDTMGAPLPSTPPPTHSPLPYRPPPHSRPWKS